MADLRELYAEAWIEDHGLNDGWLVNLEPADRSTQTLGAIGVVEDGQFHFDGTLETRGLRDPERRAEPPHEPLPWQFQSNQGIRVALTVDGKAEAPVQHVANARVGVSVDFGAQEGAAINGTTQWWSGYADMGAVRQVVLEGARDGRLHRGTSFVVEQHLTGPGVLFAAREGNAGLSLSAAADVPAGALPSIASLSGGLSVASSSGAATLTPFGDGSVLSSRLLHLGRRGWFWWREWVVYGAVDTESDRELDFLDEREGDGENEYFALV